MYKDLRDKLLGATEIPAKWAVVRGLWRVTKSSIAFLYRYSGTQAMVDNFTGRRNNAPAGMLWLLGLYIALYGWVENREDKYSQYSSSFFAPIRTEFLSNEVINAHFDTILSQEQWCEIVEWGHWPTPSYLIPNITNPATVVLSLSRNTYPQVIDAYDPLTLKIHGYVTRKFEDWGGKLPLDGIEVSTRSNHDYTNAFIKFIEEHNSDALSDICRSRLLSNDSWPTYPRELIEQYACSQLVATTACKLKIVDEEWE